MHPTTTARRGGVAQAMAVVLLVAVAVIHLIDLPGKLDETPYLGALYVIGPIGTSLVAAVLVARKGDRRAWLLAGGIAAATFIGYVLSRTTGLPGATDDIGNWGETLGVASLVVEALLVLVAGSQLRRQQIVAASVGGAEEDEDYQRIAA